MIEVEMGEEKKFRCITCRYDWNELVLGIFHLN